jgi:hypothetical protein
MLISPGSQWFSLSIQVVLKEALQHSKLLSRTTTLFGSIISMSTPLLHTHLVTASRANGGLSP